MYENKKGLKGNILHIFSFQSYTPKGKKEIQINIYSNYKSILRSKQRFSRKSVVETT